MKKKRSLSYASAGVNISAADKAKAQMEKMLKTNDNRVLNSVGAFASLYDGKFTGYKHPVLVMKTEEPGSKQLLAFQHNRIESICEDMINHLVNDIIVMGATPLAVQDAVICGRLEKTIVTRIVAGIARACRVQGCVLTGGETSEQPGVIPAGTYILTSSILGVVEKSQIIDGRKIRPEDVILAVASNGLHTNGYSLLRALLKKKKVGGPSFMNAILKPHTCYYHAVKGIFVEKGLHGMAHITGSGIEGNLERILPKNMDAHIALSALRILPIFTMIRNAGKIADAEMLRTYNMGVGLIIVTDEKSAARIQKHIRSKGHACYPIGEVTKGKGRVRFAGKLRW